LTCRWDDQETSGAEKQVGVLFKKVEKRSARPVFGDWFGADAQACHAGQTKASSARNSGG
jgi:hypothetical protein